MAGAQFVLVSYGMIESPAEEARMEMLDLLEEGLIREDGQVLYPVREGIPIMLLNEAISLDES